MHIYSVYKFVGANETREERLERVTQEYRAETVQSIVVHLTENEQYYHNLTVGEPRDGFPWQVCEVSFDIVQEYWWVDILPEMSALENLMQNNPGFILRYSNGEFFLDRDEGFECS